MRRANEWAGFAACFSLLMLQLNGVHLHADEHGHIGLPESAYSHEHGAHGHGHSHDAGKAARSHSEHDADHDHAQVRDVSLLDLSAPAFKLPVAIVALVLLFGLLPRVAGRASLDVVYPVLSGRHTRWRPPLRAPPLFA